MDESIERRWAELSPLLDEALDLEPGARAAWLDQRCRDPELRAALERLIADAERELAPLDAGSAGYARALIDDAAEAAAVPELIGRRLGPYRLLRLIGEGGMASVFLAERDDGGFAQQVAIKVLRHGIFDPYEQRRFLRERQILARLEHPNIARLIDGGLTAEGVPWFAMEYVEGETIDEHCDRRALDVDARLRLFLTVCEAVQYAHRALVVHRDLKPSNILVRADGSVKLLDFGIARLVEDEAGAAADATVTTHRRLTPAYAAPEQFRGETVTTAADVYALGALLHALLTGLKPARRDDDTLRAPSAQLAAADERAALARRRATTAPQLRRRLAGDLDMILRCALRSEPERRYASAAAFADDLRRHLERRPVRARPDSLRYRAGRYLRRHRLGLIAAGLVLLSLAVGLVATLRQAGEARRAAELARVQAQRAQSVKEFLLGLFEGAAPNRSLGRDVTARELLDRGVLALPERLSETPALRAELQLTLAGIYRELGQFDDASRLLAQARADAAEPAAVAIEAGRIAFAETRYEDAEAALRDGLAALGAEAPPAQRANVTSLLAEVLAVRDRKDDAEALVREAIALDQAGGAPDALALARDQAVLGQIAFGRGDLPGAEAAMREALRLRVSALGDTHTQVATTRHDLGVILLQRGAIDDARAALEQALATRRQLLGTEHPDTASTLFNLGALERRQGDLPAAEQHYAEAAGILRRLFPDGHSELAVVLNSLAVLAHERGDLDLAIARMDEAVAGARAAYGERHPTVATMLNNFASMLRLKGDLARAEAVQREAMALLATAVGERHHLYGVALNGLAFIELESGRTADAHAHFDAAAGIIIAALSEAHPDYAAVLTGRAEAALALGDTAAAIADARAAMTIVLAALPAQHPRVRRTRLALADALSAGGECADALVQADALAEAASASERTRLDRVRRRCS